MRRPAPISLLLVAVALAASCGGGEQAVRIGVITVCPDAGPPFSQDHEQTLAGAELPLIERGASLRGEQPSDGVSSVDVAGRPVELVVGCERVGDRRSTLAELRRLVEREHVDMVAGPNYVGDGLIVREYARRHPGIAFLVNGGEQTTTLADPVPNLFRFETNGAQWSAGLASFAFHELGWRTVATVGQNDPSGWVLVSGFDAEFCALGGSVERRLWASGGATDLGRLAAKVPPAVDGVFLPGDLQATGSFVEAWADRRDPARSLVLGWGAIDPGNGRLDGVVAAASAPFTAHGPWQRYQDAFAEAFERSDASGQGVTYYDAMEPLLQALERVDGDTSGGERAVMQELARMRYASPLGPIRLDEDGQAIGNAYLGRIEDGAVRQIRVVPETEQTFGGYFDASSPPPSRSAPACVRRTPPPWAVAPSR